MRVDAHQHCWLLADRDGAWPPEELAAIHRDFVPADLAPILAEQGIDATVLVQSLPTRADTDYLLALAAQHDFVRGVVGWVDLKAADAPAQIAALAANPLFKGVRPMLQDIADDRWIADPALAPAVEALVAAGLSFDALVLPRHLPALLEFAQRYPALPICIDHAAKPPVAIAAISPWAEDLARLAALPQVVCKVSGLITEAGPGWTTAQLQPYGRHVLDCFGAQRVLWGSDWPVLNLAGDYAAWMVATDSLLAHLDAAQRAQVLGLNAQRFYRLGEQ